MIRKSCDGKRESREGEIERMQEITMTKGQIVFEARDKLGFQ